MNVALLLWRQTLAQKESLIKNSNIITKTRRDSMAGKLSLNDEILTMC